MDAPALLAELPRLRRYARALLGERGAADDLVQDTLEHAWAKRHQWQAGGSLRAWLFGIMHNLRIDSLRRAGLMPSPLALDDEANGDHGDLAASLATRPTQSDALEIRDLVAALARLPEAQRAVLLCVGLEAMSYAETAAVLNIPVGTVMSRLARGREQLRMLLAGGSPPRMSVVK